MANENDINNIDVALLQSYAVGALALLGDLPESLAAANTGNNMLRQARPPWLQPIQLRPTRLQPTQPRPPTHAPIAAANTTSL